MDPYLLAFMEEDSLDRFLAAGENVLEGLEGRFKS